MRLLAIGLVLFASTAAAQPSDPTVGCAILEITAAQGKEPSIDGELERLKKKFKKPPFSSWNQFKLAMKEQRTLTKGKPEAIPLKHGKATATLVEIVDKSKVRLVVTVTDPQGKKLVDSKSTVEAGDYLVHGHSLANNDGHLLALTCK